MTHLTILGEEPTPLAPPLNLREVEDRTCVTCETGKYDGPTFTCQRPDGPTWERGEETDHVCDLWQSCDFGGE